MIQITARLVVAQLLSCLGSFKVVGDRVSSQASIPYEDMPAVIALLTLWPTLGSSIGSAVSSAIWADEMLDRIFIEMPCVSEKVVSTRYGNIKKLRASYEFEDGRGLFVHIPTSMATSRLQLLFWLPSHSSLLCSCPVSIWVNNKMLSRMQA